MFFFLKVFEIFRLQSSSGRLNSSELNFSRAISSEQILMSICPVFTTGGTLDLWCLLLDLFVLMNLLKYVQLSFVAVV